MSDQNDSDEWQFRSEEEEQAAEEAFAQAVRAIEAGQAIEQVLNGFDKLPEHVRQKLRRRLQQVAQEKEMREHEMARQTREKQQGKAGFSKLFSMSMLGGVISRETIEKVQMLFAQRPQLRQEVSQQGHKMIRNGVEPDIQFQPSQQAVSPSVAAGADKAQQKDKQR